MLRTLVLLGTSFGPPPHDIASLEAQFNAGPTGLDLGGAAQFVGPVVQFHFSVYGFLDKAQKILRQSQVPLEMPSCHCKQCGHIPNSNQHRTEGTIILVFSQQ